MELAVSILFAHSFISSVLWKLDEHYPLIQPVMHMNLSSWVMAARPRTLTLSVTPVLVGFSLAWSINGKIDVLAVLAAFLGSMFIQLGTNLHNDVIDSDPRSAVPSLRAKPRSS